MRICVDFERISERRRGRSRGVLRGFADESPLPVRCRFVPSALGYLNLASVYRAGFVVSNSIPVSSDRHNSLAVCYHKPWFKFAFSAQTLRCTNTVVIVKYSKCPHTRRSANVGTGRVGGFLTSPSRVSTLNRTIRPTGQGGTGDALYKRVSGIYPLSSVPPPCVCLSPPAPSKSLAFIRVNAENLLDHLHHHRRHPPPSTRFVRFHPHSDALTRLLWRVVEQTVRVYTRPMLCRSCNRFLPARRTQLLFRPVPVD